MALAALTCTVVVRLARTVGVVVLSSIPEALLALESAGLLHLLPSCSGYPVCV